LQAGKSIKRTVELGQLGEARQQAGNAVQPTVELGHRSGEAAQTVEFRRRLGEAEEQAGMTEHRIVLSYSGTAIRRCGAASRKGFKANGLLRIATSRKWKQETAQRTGLLVNENGKLYCIQLIK
jgi:hypothetical protein